MMSDEQELRSGEHSIQWCLLSHTNIGKTTLTRTLMAGDVGEIEDAAHVTSQSQRYLLQKTQQGDELWLWDTPGFGDSVRLYERLRQQGNPLGWFLSNVWDRWRDKPFYLSQRALLAARDHADVMLYLVNAAEDPADAGYWSAEMNILAWLEKPVIVLLNQIGSETTQEQAAQDLQRWKQATQSFRNVVRDVLVLDAFTRSWWHERKMMQSIEPLLPAAKQEAYRRLLQQRQQQQQQREQASLQVMAEQLQMAAGLHEKLDPEQGKLLARAWQGLSQLTSRLSKSTAAEGSLDAQARAAVERLMLGLRQSDVLATQRLLEIHQLDGQAASQIQEQLRSQLKVSKPVDAQAASLWGAVTAGAATGLGADLMAGGLTLGTGALVGALVGALTLAAQPGGQQDVRPGAAELSAIAGLLDEPGQPGAAQIPADLPLWTWAWSLHQPCCSRAMERCRPGCGPVTGRPMGGHLGAIAQRSPGGRRGRYKAGHAATAGAELAAGDGAPVSRFAGLRGAQ